jgi:hypothetical protein
VKVAILLLVAALSGTATATTMKAVDLRDKCVALELVIVSSQSSRAPDPHQVAEAAGCSGYLEGFSDAAVLYALRFKTPQMFCFTGLTSMRQMAAAYVQYVNARPQDWEKIAASVLPDALAQAFPCKP